ncbi:hypothetical protein [uncultured Litoreibacter sp.]|uniref:hypothetical protein n=1 Tax=uncultured Litoreibacter sp. TaxID=1392394 RepID=UPI0026164B55|nr:hypothetical protein [uncultured Litoreibacter sp.]
MITNEFILVFGIVIGVLAIPAIMSAWMDGSAPRVASFAVVISGAMIVYAIYNTPGGYSVNELPDIFTRVVASFL